MRPKCQMIDPTAPPGSQKSISSWTLKGSSPSEATSKKKKGKKGKEKKKDKAKGKVEVKSKIMVKWTVQQVSELENNSVGKLYDQPDFVPDAGIERYMSSGMLDQYPDRFEHGKGRRQQQLTETDGDPAADSDYEHLSSSSSKFSFVEGEEVLTVQKQRLPRDSYHEIINELANNSLSNISDLNSSVAPSSTEIHPDYAAFLAQARARDAGRNLLTREEALNLIMSRRDSRESFWPTLPHLPSDAQVDATSSTPAGQSQGPATRPRPQTMFSFGSRLATTESMMTIPERPKLNEIIVDGKKYFISENGSITPENFSAKTANSFANMTIRELVQRHPQLQPELEALKSSMEDHARNLRKAGAIEQKKLQDQVDE
jgi:hypothetical protein